MSEKSPIIYRYKIPNQRRRSGSQFLHVKRPEFEERISWILDEANSSSGSQVYRRNVDKSLIALMPESRETFIENKTIIDRLANFLLRFAN